MIKMFINNYILVRLKMYIYMYNTNSVIAVITFSFYGYMIINNNMLSLYLVIIVD